MRSALKLPRQFWELAARARVMFVLLLPMGSALSLQGQHGVTSFEVVDSLGGLVRAVAVDGARAYFGVGPKVLILDVSEPEKPTLLGESPVFPDVVRGLAVRQGYLYVVVSERSFRLAPPWNSSLRIVDVRAPTRSKELGVAVVPGRAAAVSVVGGLAYVAAGIGGLAIVDVAVPDQPRLLATVDLGGWTTAVAVGDAHAYVTNGLGALHVVDISDSTQPASIAEVGAGVNLNSVALASGVAFVVGERQDSGLGEILVIDVGTPARPRILRRLRSRWPTDAVAAGGRYLYVVGGGVLEVFDVSTPEEPKSLSAGRWPQMSRALIVDEGYAYVAADVGRGGGVSEQALPAGLRIVDVRDPLDQRAAARFDVVRSAYKVAFAEGTAYLASRLSDPLFEDLLAVPLHEWRGYMASRAAVGIVRDLVVAGDFIYAAVGSDVGVYGQLAVFDRARLHRVGQLETSEVKAVAVEGAYAFLAVAEGMLVADVTNPQAPHATSVLETTGRPMDLVVESRVAYVLKHRGDELTGEILVIDVSDPGDPRRVSSIQGYAAPQEIAMEGNYVYAAYRDGLQILDARDMRHLREVRFVNSEDRVVGLEVLEDKAIVLKWGRGATTGWLSVVDLSVPEDAHEIGALHLPGPPFDVAEADGELLIADEDGGLVRVRDAAALATPTTTGLASSTPSRTVTGTPTPTSTQVPTPNPVYLPRVSNQVP